MFETNRYVVFNYHPLKLVTVKLVTGIEPA